MERHKHLNEYAIAGIQLNNKENYQGLIYVVGK